MKLILFEQFCPPTIANLQTLHTRIKPSLLVNGSKCLHAIDYYIRKVKLDTCPTPFLKLIIRHLNIFHFSFDSLAWISSGYPLHLCMFYYVVFYH